MKFKNISTHQISALYVHYDAVEDHFTIPLLSETTLKSGQIKKLMQVL